jgi:DNA-binding SARP family transcriptional activator/predicted ATPase
MGEQLQFHLLGGLEITRDGVPVTDFISNKVPALLAYLVVTRRLHTRDKLATLLWSEMSEVDAKNNLRQTLTNLRKIAGEYVTITRDSVVFAEDCFLDVLHFEQSLRLKDDGLNKALALYRGDFLEGFFVREAPDFEEWMLGERTRLRELALQGLHRLTEIEMKRGDNLAALNSTSRLLAFDPWREEAHRLRMLALARAGQRSAALAQYQTCRRILEKELGVEPSAETTSLYQQIRTTENVLLHNLTANTTSFVGREPELAEIAIRLADPNSRVLTLIGVGGVGKSRLALQAAQSQVHQFLGGVWFIPLSAAKNIDGLFLSIAGALKVNLIGGDQIQQYLKDKNILLILDGMEHLINDAVLHWITETLHHASQIKMLVTSLVRLNIQAETLLEVHGLPHDNSVDSPASKLFLERARQLKPDFSPKPADIAAIARLSDLVDGSPLALELAAAWVRGLSVPDIVKEIEHNLDILKTSQPDFQLRHRSMRAVFDYFWQLLTREEQIIFQKQAVFRDGFTKDAFLDITQSDLFMLSRFVDKSAFKLGEDGRYRRHSLMSQFARLQLRENPELETKTRERHARYFAQWVKQLETEFMGGQPQKVLSFFLADLANIRLAWEWAVEYRVVEIFNDLSDSIMQAFDLAGLYRDAYELAEKALQALNSLSESGSIDIAIAKGRVLGLAGAFMFRLGDYQQAMDLCQRSLRILEAASPHLAYAHSLVFAGCASFGLGDLNQVIMYWQKSVEAYRAVGSKWGDMTASSNLAEALIATGRLEEGKTNAEYALALSHEMNNLEMVGGASTHLANLALQERDFSLATEYAEEALRCHQAVGHDAHIANSMAMLAKIAFQREDYEEARRMLEESIGILARVGNQLYLEQRRQELSAVLSALYS